MQGAQPAVPPHSEIATLALDEEEERAREEREEQEVILTSLHSFVQEAFRAVPAPQQPGPGDSTDLAGGSL